MKTVKQLVTILVLITIVTAAIWAIGQSSALAQNFGPPERGGEGFADGDGFPGRPPEGFPERGDFFEGDRDGPRGRDSGLASFLPILLPMIVIISAAAILTTLANTIRRRRHIRQKQETLATV